MKVIYDGLQKKNQGVEERDNRPVWVNTDVTCSECESVFVLEAGDQVLRIGSQDENFGHMGVERMALWSVACPVCKQRVKFTAGLASLEDVKTQ